MALAFWVVIEKSMTVSGKAIEWLWDRAPAALGFATLSYAFSADCVRPSVRSVSTVVLVSLCTC